MNLKYPKLTALQFYEYINIRDIKGLSSLKTEDHLLIGRKRDCCEDMING